MNFTENRPLYNLREIAAILRGEHGCVWDKAQTSSTLKPYLIEEAYEVYDAIENNHTDNLREELGDLLYQVYAHAQIAEEEGRFTIDQVAEGIITKLIRRHPHVFGNDRADTPDAVIQQWEIIKKREKASRESILDGVPRHLPALLRAYRVQQKVSRVGFDWERIDDIIAKLDEEVDEFKEAITVADKEKISEEIGDILFTIANIARRLEINAEDALVSTIQKFIHRFQYIERQAGVSGKELSDMSLSEMDALWEEAKNEFIPAKD